MKVIKLYLFQSDVWLAFGGDKINFTELILIEIETILTCFNSIMIFLHHNT